MNDETRRLVDGLKAKAPPTPNGKMPRILICECDKCQDGCTFLVPGQYHKRVNKLKLCPKEGMKPRVRVTNRLGLAPSTWADDGNEPTAIPIKVADE